MPPFDMNDELDKVIAAARDNGVSEDEIISNLELKKMAIEEEEAAALAEQNGTLD